MTLRILFVCDYYPPHVGGAELVYKRYCEGLVERGHSVKVITIKHSMKLPNEEVLNGVEIQRVITPLNSRYLFIFYSGREILSSARDVDIVHCAFFMAPFPSYPIAKLYRKPLVVTIHEVWGRMWFKFERNFLRAFINYLGEKLLMHVPYNAIICCSLYTLNSLRLSGIRNDLITYIPNGAELDLFSPRSADYNLKRKLGLDDSKIYMYYGRPGISKGICILIKAAALVKKRFEKSKLLLILGREPSREYKGVLKLIDKLNLQDHICLLDTVPRKDLPKYIALADLIVVPSLSEGFGFTAVEAEAMEKPVVATYAGSLPEIISHEETGLLVKPNSVIDLSNAISRLLGNESAVIRMGRAGRKKIIKFDWNSTIDLIEKLYNRFKKDSMH